MLSNDKRRRRERGTLWKALRVHVFRRDGYVCQSCGLRGQVLECDHVIPLDQGGTDHPDNLQALCVACHAAKTRRENRTHHVDHQEEWEMFAKLTPAQRRLRVARL